MVSSKHTKVAPVALFVYRRPQHTARVLEDLLAAHEAATTSLFIFSDAAAGDSHLDGVNEVRALCRQVSGFAQLQLIERESSLGCAANVIDGVSQVLAEHDHVIVVEDDLRLSPWFLRYMNKALAQYRSREDIMSISGFAPAPEAVGIPQTYTEDVYLSRRNASCGWATWADRWREVDWSVSDYASFCNDRHRRRDFDRGGNDLSLMLDAQMSGKIDSWSIRFSYAHFVHQAYSVCPCWSYVDHAGDDGSGTHVAMGGGVRVDLSHASAQPNLPADLQADDGVLEALRRYYSEPRLSALIGRVPGARQLIKLVKQRLGIHGRVL